MAKPMRGVDLRPGSGSFYATLRIANHSSLTRQPRLSFVLKIKGSEAPSYLALMRLGQQLWIRWWAHASFYEGGCSAQESVTCYILRKTSNLSHN